MRRLLAALAALLILSPEASSKTLVIRSPREAAENPQDWENQFSNMVGLMNRRGGSFVDIPATAARTLWASTGTQVWRNGTTEQFDAVVVLNFSKNTTYPTGFSPCSLAVSGISSSHAGWPTVTVVIVGNTAASANKWTAAATCSTAAASNGGAYTSVKRTYVSYPVGSPKVWRSMSVNLWPVVASTVSSGVTMRKIVAMNYSAATPGGLPGTTSLLRTDADSTSFTGDSLVMWALYAPTVTNAKPVIFVEAGAGVAQDVGLMAMAMQMADSASGGRVWDKAGAAPIKIGFGVTAAVGRGYYTQDLSANVATGTWSALNGGVFCQSDSCDTTNVLAGLDSLGTLAGLKTTFFVDPCSLATYPSVKNWFSRAGTYRVAMQTKAGAVGSGTTAIMGASSSTYPADALGRLRTRLAAVPTGGCTAASDTMLTYCNLVWGQGIISNYFPGLLDHSLYPAFGDWSPAAYTRIGGGPGRDSVVYAIWKSGIRTIVIRPEFANTNTNISFSSNGPTNYPSGGVSPATDPFGYGPDPESIPVYGDTIRLQGYGRVVGRLKIVAERGQELQPNVHYGYSGHDIKTEWFDGLLQDRWYLAPIRYYHHSFWSHTPIITISLGRLGGHGVLPGAVGVGPAHNGWWTIKHIANEVNAANALGWVDARGRQRRVFEFAYISEMEP